MSDPPDLPPVVPERKAAWWCWPLIVLPLIPFSWFPVLSPETEDSSTAPALHQSDLAMLKMQGQVVIATARFDSAAVGVALDDLGQMVTDDYSIAALALLESFVIPDSARAEHTLKRLSNTAPTDLVERTERAIREGLNPDDRDRLRARLGWFADLARGPDLSPPPLDQEIRTRSFIVLGVMGLILTGLFLGIAVGAVLLILHLRRLHAGKTVNRFDPTRRPIQVLLECFALYLGIMTLSGFAGAYLNTSALLMVNGAAVVIPLLWPRFRGVAWKDFCAAVGLHRGAGWMREIGAGVVGYLVVLTIALMGILLTLLLTLMGGIIEGQLFSGDGGGPPIGPQEHPIVGWIYSGSVWTKVACLVLASGFAPFFEELFFRGALQRYFRGRFRFLLSALFTGIIFAALHPQGFYAIPALAGISIGFSLLREWRDSLIAPMVAHSINNGVLIGMLWWIL